MIHRQDEYDIRSPKIWPWKRNLSDLIREYSHNINHGWTRTEEGGNWNSKQTTNCHSNYVLNYASLCG